MRLRPADIIAGIVILGALLVGCTREPTHISLQDVPPPKGGSPLTLVSTDDGVIAAPTGNGLFVRNSDDASPWRKIDIPWPARINSPTQSPTESMETSLDGLGFSGEQRFTSHRGRFWLVARPGPDRQPVLLVSDSTGRDWSSLPLPPMYSREGRLESPGSTTPSRRLRLLDYGGDGLFLVDQQRVWAFNETALRTDAEAPDPTRADAVPRPDTGSSAQPTSDTGSRSEANPDGESDNRKVWQRLDILDLRRSGNTHHLPPAIRHYVPAAENRPYEVLTVFSDRLYVYRRWQQAERWLLISSFPTADRQIRTLPTGSIAMLVGNRIRRSMQEAEQWETLDLRETEQADTSAPPPDRATAKITTFSVSRAGDDKPRTLELFAGTRSGAIYKTNQRGHDWQKVRSPSDDQRRVTALEPREDSTWASLDGLGVIRSTNDGESWSAASDGLRATEPLDMATSANGELLLATRAGLFRLTGRPQQGNYEAIHSRATSAVTVSPNGNWVVSGTLTGELIVQTPEGRLRTFQARGNPGQGVRVRPHRTIGQRLPDTAILEFAGRPGSDTLYAVPGRGPLWRTSGRPLDWRSVPVPPSLQSTLQHTIVSNVLADADDTDSAGDLFMVSRGLRQSDRQRLWRSSSGRTWQSVSTFGPEPPPGRRLFGLDGDDVLFTASSQQLQASADAGDTWRSVAPEWGEAHPLMAYSVMGHRHVLVHRAPHTTVLRLIQMPDRTDESKAHGGRIRPRSSRRLELAWRDAGALPVSPISDVAIFESSLYVTTGRSIFFGSIPAERVQIPHGPTIAITLLLLVVLASLSFLFLYHQTD
jgi:hypothetical protein